jgi:CRISPR-associated protein Cas8a1/Csx13
MAVEMVLRLNAPGMNSLHKAGLAGLYMTLRAFDVRNEKIPGLEWRLEPTHVTLSWHGDTPKAAFERLIDKSFRIDDEGFIRLAGLELDSPPSKEKKHHLYTALLHSFLQFGPHRPTENKRTLTYDVDNHLCFIRDFAPIKKFRHQEAVNDFINNEGVFKPSIEAAGWLYPGGGQRHVVHNNTKLNEPIDLALALVFAPVGVVYYVIKSRAKGRKARLAMLIPEFQDLELYSEIRRALAAQGVLELTASSASDAALRMPITIAANHTSNEFAVLFGSSFVCRVVTFGIVSWNEKQKSRTYTRSVVSGQLHGLENYRTAAAIFKNRWQRVPAKSGRKGKELEPERFFVTTFSARELIADNIAQRKVWYHDIASYANQKETREQLLYERKELHEMVESTSFDDESERLFIGVCRESWRRRMGKLGERARNENLGDAGFRRLVNKEAEKLRTSLARSKNADTLRETVVDFWARGGANEALQGDGLMKLLPLFNEKNWRKARDLALLSLISYQPQSAAEKEALETSISEGGDEES